MTSMIIIGIVGAGLLYLINKKARGIMSIALSVAVIHHFFLHGILQPIVINNFPSLVAFLDKIPGSLGSTFIVTLAIYFIIRYYGGK